jgi:hypothetical protein
MVARREENGPVFFPIHVFNRQGKGYFFWVWSSLPPYCKIKLNSKYIKISTMVKPTAVITCALQRGLS